MMKQLVIVFLLIHASVAQNHRDAGPAPAGVPVPAQQYIPPPKNWLTLDGKENIYIYMYLCLSSLHLRIYMDVFLCFNLELHACRI